LAAKASKGGVAMAKFLVIVVLVGLFFYPHLIFADEAGGILSDAGFEFSADLAMNSIYVWRGIMLDGDPVVQPGFYLASAPAKWGKVKFGFWMSRDMENNDSLASDETDYIFDYTYTFADLDLSLGHIYYDFPDLVASDGSLGGFSREFYLGLGLPNFLLSPSVYYYYDYGRKEDGGGAGSYTVLNLAHSIPVKLSEKYACSLDFSVHFGYNHRQYYRGDGGDAAIGAGFSIPLVKNLSFKPNINYSIPWGNVSDKNNGNQKNRFYGGVYLSYSF
jgi:hypothetical protein